MNNFSDDQIQELIDSGFTNENITFLQTLGFDYERLHGDIMYLLDNGSSPEEIMAEYRGQPNEAVEGSEEPQAVEEGEDKFVGADEQKEATMNGGKRHKRKGRINKTTRKIKKSKNVRKSRKGKKMRKTKRRGAK
jgi:hypothetical protein